MKSNPEGNDPDIPFKVSVRIFTKSVSGELSGKCAFVISRQDEGRAAGMPGIKTIRAMTGPFFTSNVQ